MDIVYDELKDQCNKSITLNCLVEVLADWFDYVLVQANEATFDQTFFLPFGKLRKIIYEKVLV